jgi:hypothetical protein
MHLVARCAAYFAGVLDHPMRLSVKNLIIFQNFGIGLRLPVQAHNIKRPYGSPRYGGVNNQNALSRAVHPDGRKCQKSYLSNLH